MVQAVGWKYFGRLIRRAPAAGKRLTQISDNLSSLKRLGIDSHYTLVKKLGVASDTVINDWLKEVGMKMPGRIQV